MRCAVNRFSTSVVRAIRTLRSVGAGSCLRAPGDPVAPGDGRPYRDTLNQCRLRTRTTWYARFCEPPCQPGVRGTDLWLMPFALALSR
jgi:hypothetical protein